MENNEEMKQDSTFNTFQAHNVNILKVKNTLLIQKVQSTVFHDLKNQSDSYTLPLNVATLFFWFFLPFYLISQKKHRHSVLHKYCISFFFHLIESKPVHVWKSPDQSGHLSGHSKDEKPQGHGRFDKCFVIIAGIQ